MDEAVGKVVSFRLATKIPMKFLSTEFQQEQFAIQVNRIFRAGLFGKVVWYAGARKNGSRTILTLRFMLDHYQTRPDETLLIQAIGDALRVEKSFGCTDQWTLSGWECWYVSMEVTGGDADGMDQEFSGGQRVPATQVRGSLRDLLEFWR